MYESNNTGILQSELERIANSENSNHLRFSIDTNQLSGEEQKLAPLFAKALENVRVQAEYGSVKYTLTNKALHIANWDMDVVSDDPVNPNNKFTWSQEFRHLIGFSGLDDFPDVLSSWSSRLHPGDRQRVLSAFAAHLTDNTGQTPYNLEYRMMAKNGEYRHFRAVGLTLRNENGTPLKVAGAIEDITERVHQQEMLENILDTMDSHIYTTDLQTDEILFVNKKMAADFNLDENDRGEKCWRVVQLNQTERCPWCKKGELLANPEKTVLSEDNNPILGRTMHKIEQIIDWPGGRKVHMLQSINITEIKRAQETLIQREKSLDALNRAAVVMLSREDNAFEEAMTEGVNIISEIAAFGSLSVLRSGSTGESFTRIYHWNKGKRMDVSEGAGSLIPECCVDVLKAGKFINAAVSELPEAKELKKSGSLAILAVPILNGSSFWGYTLFENTKEEREFSALEADILRSASFMLATVVIRSEEIKKSREADERAKLMLDATPLVCRLWDKNYNLIECNEAAVSLFNLRSKQEYIERYFELSPKYQPDGQLTREKIRNVISEAFEKGGCTYEWMYSMLDGTPMPCEITLVRVPYKDDYVIAAYSRDLREQKKMIAEIGRRDHLLRTINEAADRLLRAEPESFDNNLLSCMEMMARVVGADRMRVVKNTVEDGIYYRNLLYEWSENTTLSADSVNAFKAAYTETTPEMFKTMLRREYIHKRVEDMPASDREWLKNQGVLSIIMFPVFTGDEFWGMVGFVNCRDGKLFAENEASIMQSGAMIVANAVLRNEYTLKMRDTHEKLQIMMEDTKLANNAKSSFLAHMSHEIRTPLNAVIGLSQLTLGEGNLSGEAELNLEKISSAGSTILSIVNDILDISKIETGKLETFPVQYDTPSLINDVIMMNIVRVGEKPITFKLLLDENLPSKLYGDDLRIKQIFNNLLSNAFKYTDAGTVEWRVSFERDGDDIWLNSGIYDTGRGIKPDDLKRLFSDYNQVDVQANRQIGGTGLGLSITKRLVEMMDGTIKVESEYGKGSVFHVRVRQILLSDVPIGAEVAQNLAELRYTIVRRTAYTKIARIKMPYAHVLVVDDIATNLDVVKGMLRPYGIKADCASSGPAAIEKMRRENPRYNAVFMDHMMPGMDGIEAVRIIREEIGTDYAREVPIIALTANAIAGNEEMFLIKGFQDFISKPIDMGKLDTILRSWVRDKNLEVEFSSAEEEEGETASFFASLTIDGVDTVRALERFGAGGSVWTDVLRSYALHTPPLLSRLREHLAEENLADYAIIVHGIKGSSYGIFAADAGRAAEKLEMASKNGFIDEIKSGHAAFEEQVRRLLGDIDEALKKIDAAITKPTAEEPDTALLAQLREASDAFDMDRVDTIIEQLEAFRYEKGEKLIAWLREKVNGIEFEEIAGGEWPPCE
ncbi:MAG: PAS domain-containing protein [Clostridiales bacterium]|jgi:PAS domain S-box-containing protein|nr:PAS domain-containing protein [Clostridiales bacterium]